MFRKPDGVTFTGVDERTDLVKLLELSCRFPVEWGILHSTSKQGLEPRFPTMSRINVLRGLPINRAAHLCGGYSRLVLQGKPTMLDFSGFNRIQVNYVPNPKFFPNLFKTDVGQPGALECYNFSIRHNTPVIIQHRTLTWPEFGGLLYLFDKSGGRGEAPATFPPHENPNQVRGFAGGIGPDNVLDTLEKINACGAYWIDMEGQVRTDDWLDLDKCESVLTQIYGREV